MAPKSHISTKCVCDVQQWIIKEEYKMYVVEDCFFWQRIC